MQWYYIYSKVLANIQFPGLIISGGTDRRSTEIFPAQISCVIPSFPDEGNLSIFILIFVFAIHFDPKSRSAGATPFPLSTMVGILFRAAARKPASLASPGTRGSSPHRESNLTLGRAWKFPWAMEFSMGDGNFHGPCPYCSISICCQNLSLHFMDSVLLLDLDVIIPVFRIYHLCQNSICLFYLFICFQ